MHYTPDSDTGHLTLMHERLRRLHANMRARGASPSALARLPRLPQYAAPIVIPKPVLARRHPSDAAAARRAERPLTNLPPSTRAASLAAMQPWQKALCAEILGKLEEISGLPRDCILGRQRSLFASRVRMIGMVMAKRLARCSGTQAAAWFNRDKESFFHAQRFLGDYLVAQPNLRLIFRRMEEAFALPEIKEAA